MTSAACLFFSSLLAIVAIAAAATVDAKALRSDFYILQLSIVAPPGSRLSSMLYDIGTGVVLPSPFQRASQHGRPAFVYPVPLPSSPATENLTGVVALLHHWSNSVYDPVNDILLSIPTSGALRPLTFETVPAAEVNTTGGTADWQSFVLSDGIQDAVRSTKDEDRPAETRSPQTPPPLLANTLTYAGQPGRWVAFPQDERFYALAWYDGLSPLIESYVPVDIVYQVIKIEQNR